MQPPKSIEIDLRDNKFRYTGTNDLAYLGFRVIKKYQIHASEICINNLLDLTQAAKKFDWQLNYTPAAQAVREILLNEYKEILKGKKYKTMLDDEIDEEWDRQEIWEKIPLDNYQKRAILFALTVKRGCLFLDMGLGKSGIGLTIAQHLKNNNLIRRGSTLIVAPKTLHGEDNWDGELDKFSDLTMVNVREKVDNLNNPYADCFIINADQFRVICLDKKGEWIPGNPLEKKKFELVLFDEATVLKGHNSKAHNTFQQLSEHFKYCFLMSGLPAPNSVFQLWGLVSCIGNWLGDSYAAFEERYGKQVELRPGLNKFFPRRNAEEEIKARIEAISLYMSSEEYLKLPIYHVGEEFDIPVTMCKDHAQVYKDIENEYMTIIKSKNSEDDKEIYTDNEAAARSKLLQIMAGFIYHNDEFKKRTVIRLDWNPKLDAIEKQVEIDLKDPNNNIIIWTRFKEELDIIYDDLSRLYVCAYGKGGMTDKDQAEQLKLWKHDPRCRIMVAHPGAFMYGHTWLKANFTYYSSPVDDNNHYSQSRKRNHRRGQDREVTERKFLLKDTLEKDIWTSIRKKIRLDRFLKSILHL